MSSTYDKQVWTPNVTPVTAARMSHIEDGIANAGGGGTDLVYEGDFVAGSYTDGDIVVYNGVAYICVKPTSAPPTPWSPPQTAPSYGTTFPAAPVDGQEHVLVDNVGNPSYQWRCRYNASSTSAYKWEVVGGVPIATNVQGSSPNTAADGNWSNMANGPQIVTPRAGDYDVEFGLSLQANVPTVVTAYEMYGRALVGSTPTVAVKFVSDGVYAGGTVPGFTKMVAVPSGSLIVIQGSAQNGGSVFNFSAGWLRLFPRRLA